MSAASTEEPAVEGYIDDRALDVRADDRLHLGSVADELADLVASQRTPLNVAVFGPWGSGKSSLASLLKDALKDRHAIKYVQIEAWKYADDPLRRKFIMESVDALGLDREKYRKKLYDTATHSELAMPWEALKQLAKVLAVLLGLCLAVLLLAAAVVGGIAVAANDHGHFYPEFASFLKSAAATTVVVSGVLTALFAFSGKLFVSDVTQSRVSSIEHFERVFRQVIQEATGRPSGIRVVFYIDELDRCAAKDVVAVLEGIRTFLDVKRCVFVVAADNRVLESAVQREMPHPVPDEQANPYYSSGAEYLDKLFQHQVIIPALLPQRLTAFALSLVVDRPGIWSLTRKQGSLANLVSILIPSHVRSPRRVKVLLNGFVSLYRVAKARHDEEPDYAPDPERRLSELAKLSTLRLEFPLFYRDLVRYPRLAEHLTAYLRNGNGWPEGMEAKARALGDAQLVESFATCGRAVEAMLSDGGPFRESNQTDGSADVDSQTAVSNSESARRNELLSYLLKTADVAGPSRDIIFLEGFGSSYGIPGDLAELMEEAAVDNDYHALATLVESVPEEDRINSIRFLHEARRQKNVGIEATNILGCMLRLVSRSGLVDPAPTVNELLADLTLESGAGPLPIEWLPAAVQLGLTSNSTEGVSLANSCIGDARLLEPEREDEAVEVVQAAQGRGTQTDDAISLMLVKRGAGFIATAIDMEALSGTTVARLVAETSLLALLGDRWKEAASDSDRDDVVGMSGALRIDGVDADWALAQAVADSKQTALADAWLSDASTHPATPQQTATLLGVLCSATRSYWESSASLLQGAPSTDSVVLYTATQLLFTDIGANPSDQPQQAWRHALTQVWGSPVWPGNWDADSPPEWAVSPGWAIGDVRERKMGALRLIAASDSDSTPWRKAIAQGYLDLLREGGAGADVIGRIGGALCRDWLLLDDDSRRELAEALESGPGVVAEERTLWLARISLVDDAIPFPFSADEVAALDAGSEANHEVIDLWLKHRCTGGEAIDFIRRRADTHTFVRTIVGASARYSPPQLTDIAIALVELDPPVDSRHIGPLLKRADQTSLAAWLSEELREATNRPDRERLMGVWDAWSPVVPEARRPLIEAYLHLASAGKGALELALRHIDLVGNPPKGFKKRLRETLAERATRCGLEKRTTNALLRVGLIKSERKGLFRRERFVSTDDE